MAVIKEKKKSRVLGQSFDETELTFGMGQHLTPWLDLKLVEFK